jgi:hypothetical protein
MDGARQTYVSSCSVFESQPCEPRGCAKPTRHPHAADPNLVDNSWMATIVERLF